MPDASDSADTYRRDFNPQEYLREYYFTPEVAADERAIFSTLVPWLREQGRVFERAIDIGCGPTVHHAFPLASWVRDLHLADYLEANLDEVRRWLAGDPAAHNWDVYLRGVLAIEEIPEANLAGRVELLRSRVTRLVRCDLRNSQPLFDQPGSQYDLVTSFYCAESVAESRADWEAMTRNLTSLVAPGGALVISALRRSTGYRVGSAQLPSASVDETDFERLLPELGFRAADTRITVAESPEWTDHGFAGLCVVCATKS